MAKKIELYPPVRFPAMGRPLKYTPAELKDKFLEYVQWCKDNPIVVGTQTHNTSVEGVKYGSRVEEHKPRLVGIQGFCVFIGATKRWWGELDNSTTEDFSAVKAYIRDFCEAYQKEMASAGLFNANIISRLLGLVDKQATETKTETRIIVKSEEEAEKIRNIKNLGI